MGRLFGTDGIRGIVNEDLTPELAFRLGKAGAYYLSREKERPRILIGRDTRVSGDLIESAFVAGACSVGVDVIRAGVITTPGVAYLVREMNLDAGVVISASHNPVHYNGIKFFSGNGFKLPDEMEEKIEALVLDGKCDELPVATGHKVGRVLDGNNGEWCDRYVRFLAKTLDRPLRGMKVAVDCANGAASQIAPAVFRELGARVEVINNSPDGSNINLECGSTDPGRLRRLVTETGSDVGFAFDGDGDRVIAIDEKGEVVDGDQIMAVCALDFDSKGKLRNRSLVVTVMSNLGLELAMRRAGIQVLRTKVGDRYVLEEMLRRGVILGGEQSGHIIMLDYNTTGDGVLTSLRLLQVMGEEEKPLSELSRVMVKLPQYLVNVEVPKGWNYLNSPRISEAIRSMSSDLGSGGRLVIRPSGTEPVIRIMVESEEEERAKRLADELALLISEEAKRAGWGGDRQSVGGRAFNLKEGV